MKMYLLLIATIMATNLSIGQHMYKMNWLNEPSS